MSIYKRYLFFSETHFFPHEPKWCYLAEFRKEPVPFTGVDAHKNSHPDDPFDTWGNIKKIAMLRKKKDALKYDEDHAPFIRPDNKIKRFYRPKSEDRSWKNQKLRHQWQKNRG